MKVGKIHEVVGKERDSTVFQCTKRLRAVCDPPSLIQAQLGFISYEAGFGIACQELKRYVELRAV